MMKILKSAPKSWKNALLKYENIKKGTKKLKNLHFGNPDPKIIESGQKCTSDEENIKKGTKKCQKVHFGNPDPKILESGKNALLIMKILKKAPKSAKKCT